MCSGKRQGCSLGCCTTSSRAHSWNKAHESPIQTDTEPSSQEDQDSSEELQMRCQHELHLPGFPYWLHNAQNWWGCRLSCLRACRTPWWEEVSAGEMTHVCLLPNTFTWHHSGITAAGGREGLQGGWCSWGAHGCLCVQGVRTIQWWSNSVIASHCFLQTMQVYHLPSTGDTGDGDSWEAQSRFSKFLVHTAPCDPCKLERDFCWLLLNLFMFCHVWGQLH